MFNGKGYIVAFCAASFVVGLLFIKVLSISIATVLILACFIVIHTVFITLSWRNLKKVQLLLLSPCEYKGRKGNILRIALCICSPFYLYILLFSMFPIEHYSIWFLFLLPATVIFFVATAEVSDFCRDLFLSKRIFRLTQIALELLCIAIGRLLVYFVFN